MRINGVPKGLIRVPLPYSSVPFQTFQALVVSDPLHGVRIPRPMAVSIIEATSNSSGHEGPDSDAALAAAGDRTAFERLYRRHVDRVFTLCTRMAGGPTRPGGVTQDG